MSGGLAEVRAVFADCMTASEVTERAGQYWPEAFPHGSDPSEIEYLLDEMEGFGILRWILQRQVPQRMPQRPLVHEP
jgi:hypothetical protein